MKLKLSYTPKKDANGYFLRLPNGTKKRFKTKKSFDRWFLSATNDLNGVYKILLLQYPFLSELYSELYVRSNIHNLNRLAFIQKTHNDTLILTRIFGIIPRREFYDVYIELCKLLSFYDSLLNVYYIEYTVFSDRYILSKIKQSMEILKCQNDKMNKL